VLAGVDVEEFHIALRLPVSALIYHYMDFFQIAV
jgi:hypothetical protein